MENYLLSEKFKIKPDNKNAFVVALEGPNGVGKSTLCKCLKEVDEFKYKLGVPELWMNYDMKKKIIFDSHWITAMLYFISGITEVKKEIEKESGIIVMDRSVWSTLAVTWIKGEAKFKKTIDIISQIGEFLLIPDLVIVLKADFYECQKRVLSKKDESKDFDKDKLEDFNNEIKFYEWLSKQIPNVKIIDTTFLNEEEVFKKVKYTIEMAVKE